MVRVTRLYDLNLISFIPEAIGQRGNHLITFSEKFSFQIFLAIASVAMLHFLFSSLNPTPEHYKLELCNAFVIYADFRIYIEVH